VQFLRFDDGPPGRDAPALDASCGQALAWEISGSRSRIAIAVGARGDIASYIWDEHSDPTELVERFEETGRVTELIEALKPAQRQALILLGLGYSYKEIAQMRGWSRRKVDRCVYEERAALRRQMEKGGVNS
jgi:DNA-directed RNA polymerase specialized sigma24 family protein